MSSTTAASWTRSTWCHMSSCSSSPFPSSSSVSARRDGGREDAREKVEWRGGGGARPQRSRTMGSHVFLGPLLCSSSLVPSPIPEPAPDSMGASDLRDPQVLLPQSLTRDGAPHAQGRSRGNRPHPRVALRRESDHPFPVPVLSPPQLDSGKSAGSSQGGWWWRPASLALSQRPRTQGPFHAVRR